MMRHPFRLRWPILAAAILLCATCRPDDPIPRQLQARLRAVLDGGKPAPSRDDVQQALSRQLRIGPSLPAGTTAPSAKPLFPTRETLAEFYGRHGHRLVWCDPAGKVLPRGRVVLETLRRAGREGLDPEDYSLDRLELLEGEIGREARDADAAAQRLADFDLLMTAAFFRYASDLSTGRVHPDEVRADWHSNPPEIDFVSALDQALGKDDLSGLLASLPPPHAGYGRLRDALAGLRAVQASGGWPALPAGPALVPGSRGPGVAALRRRLDVAASPNHVRRGAAVGATDDRYDRSLEEAVRRLQRLHGIEPDGKLNGRTLSELNVPVERRIQDVELNLERWRWIPRQLGAEHVLVNIPGFELDLVRNGTPVWHARIVVGKSYTPTPVFTDRIVAVVVNPPWNIPESIALKEYLPELRKDPRWLERHGFRLLEGAGDTEREVNPALINWDEVDEGRFPYRLRQDPGDDNALGRLKFDLTNEFHIYLHDTPTGHLFGKSERDLSHGCIRVERAQELAAQLLDGSPDSLREALEQKEERHIPVQPAVPVHILYWTAWVEPSGALAYGPDVYELDGPQRAALERVGSPLAQATSPGGDRRRM